MFQMSALLILLVPFLVFLTHRPVIHHKFTYDDMFAITGNAVVNGEWSGVWKGEERWWWEEVWYRDFWGNYIFDEYDNEKKKKNSSKNNNNQNLANDNDNDNDDDNDDNDNESGFKPWTHKSYRPLSSLFYGCVYRLPPTSFWYRFLSVAQTFACVSPLNDWGVGFCPTSSESESPSEICSLQTPTPTPTPEELKSHLLHLLVLLLHLIVVLMFYILLRLLASTLPPPLSLADRLSRTVLLVLFPTSVLAVHPTTAEVISNVSNGSDALGMFFGFIAVYLWVLVLYLRRRRRSDAKASSPMVGEKVVEALIGMFVCVCGGCGMLCKETSGMILVFILWGEIVYGSRIRSDSKKSKEKGLTPFAQTLVLLVPLMFYRRCKLTSGTEFEFSGYYNRLATIGGSGRSEDGVGDLLNWYNGVSKIHFRAFAMVFRHLVPIRRVNGGGEGLCIDLNFDRGEDWWGVVVGRQVFVTTVHVIVMVVTIAPLLSLKKPKPLQLQLKITHLALTGATILYIPSSQLLFPIGYEVSERGMYGLLPGVGAGVGWGVWSLVGEGKERWMWMRMRTRMRMRMRMRIGLCIYLLVTTLSMSLTTHARNKLWHDPLTLYNSTLLTNPGSLIGLRGRGWERFLAGDLTGALGDFELIATSGGEEERLVGGMVGRVRLAGVIDGVNAFIANADDARVWGTEDYNRQRAEEVLRMTKDVNNHGRPQALHDLGYLLWFSPSSSTETMEARMYFDLAIGDGSLRTIQRFSPGTGRRTWASMLNNAGCASFFSKENEGEGVVERRIRGRELFEIAVGYFHGENENENENGTGEELTPYTVGVGKILLYNQCISLIHFHSIPAAHQCLQRLGADYVSPDRKVQGRDVERILGEKEKLGEGVEVEPWCLFTFM